MDGTNASAFSRKFSVSFKFISHFLKLNVLVFDLNKLTFTSMIIYVQPPGVFLLQRTPLTTSLP